MTATARTVGAYAGPLPVPPADRAAVLAAVVDRSKLRTPPAVAVNVVRATSKADCKAAEVSALLKQDPALCGNVLKAVNSSVYGFRRTIGSIDQAIAVLGLNPLRALVLGLSLPALQTKGPVDRRERDVWIGSVSGAIMARELAVARRHPAPDDDMVAGLLRDLGAVALRQAFPDAWLGLPSGGDPCEAEREAVGLTHPEVSAELFARWNLPDHIVRPIRFHHAPGELAGDPPAVSDRAALLNFTDSLARLDDVADDPAALRQLLLVAEERYGLTQDKLVEFLRGVAPKVTAFAALLDLSVADRPDLAAVMAAGCDELAKLVTDDGTPPAPPAGPPAKSVAETIRNRPSDTKLTAAPPADAIGRTALPAFEAAHLDRLPPGGCRLGEFEVRRRLGGGTMGVVFLGFDPGLERAVAIKTLAPDLAGWPVARERFLREARTAAAVRHPNVMTIFAVRDADVSPYLVTEYLDGGTLDDRIAADGRLPLPDLLRVAKDLASGLSGAHAERIVHRDIKPANVLFDGASGRAKITDFGLARAPDSAKLTVDGALVGSPLFMSPEQVCGQPLDPRSDLFALGSVLYAAAVGRAPFAAATVPAVLQKVCGKEPKSPRAARPDLPEWLDALVLKLLRKKPGDRVQSADDVLAALRANAN